MHPTTLTNSESLEDGNHHIPVKEPKPLNALCLSVKAFSEEWDFVTRLNEELDPELDQLAYFDFNSGLPF